MLTLAHTFPVTPRLSLEELNQLIQKFQNGQEEVLTTILAHFHPTFLKYVYLLKGFHTKVFPLSYDSIRFLCLFLSYREKTPQSVQEVCRYLTHLTRSLEADDLYQQIVLLFLKRLRALPRDEETNAVIYLLYYLRWDLKDWLISQIPHLTFWNDVELVDREEEWENVPLAPREDPEPNDISEMTLLWVHRTQDTIFSRLTPYQRYLLYLYFKEGKSLRQMAGILKRTRDRLNRDFRETIALLREWSREAGHGATEELEEEKGALVAP